MIFVDTGAWFASFVPNDSDHAVADTWLQENALPLVTTDYVVDELLTLLKRRREFDRALRVGASLLGGEAAHIEWVTPNDVWAAWEIFRDYRDKGWSFTDCTSCVVMKRLSISGAFAFDVHFKQFGGITVVPG